MKLHIDHSRINLAIARAETTTSGEITCVVMAKAPDYSETPFIWGIVAMFLIPLIVALSGVSLHDIVASRLPPMFSTWEAAHAGMAHLNQVQSTGLNTLIQLVIFAAVYALVNFTRLKLFLTPRATRHHRAHAKAMEQFRSLGLHLTVGHTGVLIFCALEDRFVEVIADEGIHAKTDSALWNDTVSTLLKHLKRNELTVGFEEAVRACGIALSTHFPASDTNPNELPNVLIEI